jgi:hypothetical protein
MYKAIAACRMCGNSNLVPILDLGAQALTGVFPRSKEERITAGPLELVKCHRDQEEESCGLVQLRHSYDLHELYGDNYGYRSGLNQSMVRHLHAKVREILQRVTLAPGNLVIDIGSNDGTLLWAYPKQGIQLVGIDPTGKKFMEFYPAHIQLIPDFFSAETVRAAFGTKKARVITAIAMFYDLEDPLDFMRQVHQVLADDGIWVFEQSYMPTMLSVNAYDTICHEHLEYYDLKQIKWLTDRTGFKIVDCELNSVNGGSVSVTVAKANSPYPENTLLINQLLHEEDSRGLGTLEPYREFNRRVFNHREELCRFLQKTISDNKKILGYGASTKGNVILQFCQLTEKDIPFIAEVNTDKFGRYTPGTHIPIISEAEAKAMKPDYFMVLPWHFKKSIVEREKDYLKSGGKLFLPLPFLETIEE